ncbi:transposable element Tcb2 transposase [Trichonephila clavipes]|nr:transposable element Tcb2 transposase [Trichonephila clavipes]
MTNIAIHVGLENAFMGETEIGFCTLQTSRIPYAGAIGNYFILMDNTRPHKAEVVEGYFEDQGSERIEWSAQSSDMNPIEHLWDYFGK